MGWEWVAYPKCALACSRVGWLGPHPQRLRRLHRCALCQRHRRCGEFGANTPKQR